MLSTNTTGRICPVCEEPILVGQSVVRFDAGLLVEDGVFDPLVMTPTVYVHAGAGYDTRFNVEDRWCVTPEGLEAVLRLLRVHGETGPSGH